MIEFESNEAMRHGEMKNETYLGDTQLRLLKTTTGFVESVTDESCPDVYYEFDF